MTWQQIQKLKADRNAALEKLRAVHERGVKENRDLTGEEKAQFEALETEIGGLKKQIDTLETARAAEAARAARLAEYSREVSESPRRQSEPEPRSRDARRHDRGDRDGPDDEGDDGRRRSLRRYNGVVEVRAGRVRIRALDRSQLAHTATPEYREAFADYLRNGQVSDILFRDQTMQDMTKGGFLAVPMQMLAEILADADDAVIMRQICRVLPPTSAQSLGAGRRTSKLSSAAWGTESSEPATDNNLRFGRRELSPHYMTFSAEISRALLNGATMVDVEAIVREELGRDAAELEERAFMTGDGVNKPLGVFTVSPDGISASRDISTGNLPTTPTVDGLFRAFYALKDQYRGRATALMHRDVVTAVALLKDGNGQYLVRPSAIADRPDTIFGRPIRTSEWAPNTLTTGQYVGIFGDFSRYWIVDGTEASMQKLIETKAKQNKDEFIGRRKVDGAPVIEEAFARVKLG